ncbi:Mth938-like domain-containing protein [Rhodocista pekingensis]|uniref:Mth938-like domain-containing protein n=1 Tax=Rhodocista pekingensis TaxID=201185 RepID=A0ABW2KR88_9PROT
MDITPLIPADRQVIDTYGPGRFRISNTLYETAVLVFPDRTLLWDIRTFDGLDTASFQAVRTAEPPVELLLLGCGPRMQLLPAAVRQDLRRAGIVVEAMDTPAACRTYNVLLAEGRRVAAALLPI